MVFDIKSNVLVMLVDSKDDGLTACTQYWPNQINSSRYLKEFTVTTESEEAKNGYIERDISIVETKVWLLVNVVMIIPEEVRNH